MRVRVALLHMHVLHGAHEDALSQVCGLSAAAEMQYACVRCGS